MLVFELIDLLESGVKKMISIFYVLGRFVFSHIHEA